MVDQPINCILTINSGSSSIKFSLYTVGQSETLALSGSAERIGGNSLFHAKDASGAILVEQHCDLPNHDAALKTLFEWLQSQTLGQSLDAAGHRIVHGGLKFEMPQQVTPELIATLKQLTVLAPDHLPHEIKAIETISRLYPALKQVACFDTAFHRQMPRMAHLVALPRELEAAGVVRYGFHGLSYEYIINKLAQEAGAEIAGGRVIIAHLGNGASMAAVHQGKSVDTTMGFTPNGGLMMSTRSGDLDPAIILFLLQEKELDLATVNRMVTQQAGLLGIGGTADMQDLLDKEQADPYAAEAIALFCYQAKKFLGALASVLGGLDSLIFTAGIGENAPVIRWRICQHMEWLGIHLDSVRNNANAPIISSDNSRTRVHVIKTNEELMIARHTYQVICDAP